MGITKNKISNWKQCKEALTNRSSLIFWIDEATFKAGIPFSNMVLVSEITPIATALSSLH